MAYFAKLDENNIVTQVISVNNAEIVDSDGNESESIGIEWCRNWSGGHANWVQTSYNRKIRKNYAGVGYTWDKERDAFIPPKPFESWTLNETTCAWESPVPMPEPVDGIIWVWNESTVSWQSIKGMEI